MKKKVLLKNACLPPLPANLNPVSAPALVALLRILALIVVFTFAARRAKVTL